MAAAAAVAVWGRMPVVLVCLYVVLACTAWTLTQARHRDHAGRGGLHRRGAHSHGHHVPCPSACWCHNTTVNCTHVHLRALPQLSARVTRLTLSHNMLGTLAPDTFTSLPNLVYLNLQSNNLTTLQPDAFRGLTRLETLALDDNFLDAIPEHAFRGLDNLKRLTLAGNGLSLEAVNSSLIHVPNLETLNLRFNRLEDDQSLPGGFSFLSGLTNLELGANEGLVNITADFFDNLNASNLRYLELSSCPIEHVDRSAFLRFTGLAEIDLSYTTMEASQIENVLYGLQNSSLEALHLAYVLVYSDGGHVTANLTRYLDNTELRFLDMEGNYGGFKKHGIHNGMFRHVRHVRELDLTNCQVHSITEEAFRGLHRLKKLILKQNYISCSPDCPFITAGPTLKSLQYLDLSDNVISAQSNVLQFRKDVFPKLKTLLLSNNRLESITSKMFNQLENLKVLEIADNPLAYIEAGSFETLSSLHALVLTGSRRLSTLANGTFRGLHLLQHLNLNDNHIRAIHPRVFHGLRHLAVLEMNGNRVGNADPSDLPVVLETSVLRKLDLGNNRLSVIPYGLVARQPNLKTLILHYNRISAWDSDTFERLKLLDTLDLSYNSIMELTDESFASLVGLRYLNLAGNPFLCTCNMKAFLDWFPDSGIKLNSAHAHMCMGPSGMRGTPLLDYKPTAWDCKVKVVVVPVVVFLGVLLVVTALASVACKMFCKESVCGESSVDSNDNRRVRSWIRELLPVSEEVGREEAEGQVECHVNGDMEDPLLDESQLMTEVHA